MINQIVKFNVKPEYREIFKAALIKDKKGTELEPGSVEMRFFSDNKNPNIIFAYERFENQSAVDYHMTQPYTKEIMSLAEKALAEKPEFLSLGETTPAPLPVNKRKQPNSEDDVFVIFFIFKIKDGYKEKLIKRFEEHIKHTRQEDGCLLFDLYTVNNVDNTLAVYEHWRKESDVWDIHFKQPYAEITGALMHEAVIGDLEQYMNFVTEIF